MGERLLCKQEVIGSIPFTSTNLVSVKIPNRQVCELGKKCHSRLVFKTPAAGLLIEG